MITPENNIVFSPHKKILKCGDCEKFKTQQCSYAEKNSEQYLITSTDSICEGFQIKKDYDPFLEGGFNAKVLGDLLKRKEFFASQDENDYIWTYNKKTGIWENNGCEKIAELTTGFLGKDFKPERVSEVKKYIQYTTFLKNKELGGPSHKIVVSNGVLNLITGKLESFCPDDLHIVKIPVKFDETADCPIIKKFLFEIVNEKDVDKLIEFAGYCLFKEYPIAKFLVLTGEGSNGKSTYLNLLKAFLGIKNISGLSLQQLSEPSGFTQSKLFGKLANICGDIPAKALKDTGMLKTITGRDLITADRKYKSMIEFVNYAKAIFSANKLPASRDETDAYHRRAVVIDFPNQFKEDDTSTDVTLDKKLQSPKELSGFLNLAIVGLQILLMQGKFSNELSTEEKRLNYMKKSDPIQYFCRLFVKEELENVVTKENVYNYYVKLCHAINHKPTSSNWFSQSFKRSIPFAEDTSCRDDDGKKHRVWRGISIDLELLNKEINENIVPKNTINDVNWNARNDRNDISVLLSLETKNLERNNKGNIVDSVPTVPNNVKSGTISNQKLVCFNCKKELGLHETFKGNDMKTRCADCNMDYLLGKRKDD
jgi:P4 family phage/plasmid primase-like protien